MGTIVHGLAYPAKSAPLTLVAVFALLMAMAIFAGVLGIVLGLTLLSWFLKYSFVLFDDITLGRPEPSVLSAEMVNPVNEQRPLGVLAIVAVFYILPTFLQPTIGHQAVTAIHLTELLLLPASAATLGITGNLLEAVNPVTLFGFARRLGLKYLAVVIVITLLAVVIVEVFLPRLATSFFGQVAVFAVILYTWLAMFSVLGLVIYEQRDRLGLETWHSPEQSDAKARSEVDRERDRFADELYSHWRVGSYANAAKALEKHLAAAANVTDDYLWIHERVARWPDPRPAQKLARDVLPRLLEAKRNSEALAILRSEIGRDAQFRPQSSADLVRLVNLTRDAGDRSTARKLLADFETRYPNDPARPIVERLQQELTR